MRYADFLFSKRTLHRKDKEYKLVCGRVEKPCVQTSPISPPLFSETVWTVMQKTIIFTT